MVRRFVQHPGIEAVVRCEHHRLGLRDVRQNRDTGAGSRCFCQRHGSAGRIVLITVKGYGVILLESQRGFRIAAVSRRVDRDIGRLEDNEGESELGYSSVSFVDCLALGFVQSHLFLQGWRNDAPNVFSQVSVLGIAQNQHQRVVRFAVIQSRFARDRAVNGYRGEPRPLAND